MPYDFNSRKKATALEYEGARKSKSRWEGDAHRAPLAVPTGVRLADVAIVVERVLTASGYHLEKLGCGDAFRIRRTRTINFNVVSI